MENVIYSTWPGLIEHYRKYLPVSDKTPVITLKEGNTPLIFSCVLSSMLGDGFEVYYKYEGLNPTGSFKDRGMTVAVSKAKEEGSGVVMCASTGNTSASAAAYAARAGMKCFVLIPEGNIALGKLSQAMIHNATVLAIKGNFDEALHIVRDITATHKITLVNSLNPYRLQGQKTMAFEICDALGEAPDFQIIPVGNAGNITASWMGYKEYRAAGITTKRPKMLGFQAAGSAPIVKNKIIKKPHTLATAIKIGNPASWKQAVEARDDSGGLIDMVTDKEIVSAYKYIAAKDGVFAEPASCASVAGLIKLTKTGYFKKARLSAGAQRPIRIVCILTGHGLKDPDRAIASIKKPKSIPATMKAVLKEIGY